MSDWKIGILAQSFSRDERDLVADATDDSVDDGDDDDFGIVQE